MNTNRWIGKRGYHPSLRERADYAERWHAVTLAAGAVGVEVDARKVTDEMDNRLYLAFKEIDNNSDYEDWVHFTQDLRHGG